MRVAYINTVCGFSSTGKITQLLAANKNIESKIYYGRKSYDGNLNTFKFNNLAGNSVHALSTFIIDNHGYMSGFETEILIKDLKKFDPDIVHLHNLHGFYLHVGKLFEYLKKSRAKVVWTFHDCWPFTGHCAYYDWIGCDKWKTKCMNCPAYLSYPPTFNKLNVNKNFERKRMTFTSLPNLTIVTPSNWLKTQISMSFLKDINTKVINNGIDLSIYHPVPLEGINSNKKEIIAVASYWTKQKGFDDLVLFSKLLSDDEHLTVIGLNKKQFKSFDSKVTCIERTSNQSELVEFYSKADFFINFTYEDNFPTVNLEALACGCPVITYNTGGSTEMLTDSTGFVVDKGDFKHALAVIRSNHEINRDNCVKQASLYSRDKMINDYISLYYEVLK